MTVPSSQEFNTTKNLSPLSKYLTFGLVTLILALCFCLYNLPAPFLPLYHSERNVTTVWDGVVLGTVSVGFAVTCPLSAWAMSRFTNRHILMAGSLVLGTGSIVMSFFSRIENNAAYLAASVILRLIMGVATGFIAVTSFAVLTKLIPTRVALVTALAEAALNGAQAFGPFLGGIMYAGSGYSLAYWAPGVVICLCVFAEYFIPYIDTVPEKGNASAVKVYWDPWIIFAAWHCAVCQILLYFHLPTLAPFIERALGEDVVWTGMALLINTSTIIISAPPLGYLIDKWNPYMFVMLSAVILPVLYMFLGPIPFFGLATSKAQLLTVLALLGFFVPMGCTPVLLIMFDVYKIRHGGQLPVSVSNIIVSIYCMCFPAGAVMGSFAAGIVSEYLSFEWSTGIVGLLFFLQSITVTVYCYKVKGLKSSLMGETKLLLPKDRHDTATEATGLASQLSFE